MGYQDEAQWSAGDVTVIEFVEFIGQLVRSSRSSSKKCETSQALAHFQKRCNSLEAGKIR